MKLNNLITAKVKVFNVTDSTKPKSTWKSWDIEIDRKLYTSDKPLPRLITVISPNQNRVVSVGDTLSLTGTDVYQTWFLNETDPFTAKNPRGYKRDPSKKVDYEIDGQSVTLYKFPDLGKVNYFEVRPVVVYYNPLTDERVCEPVLDSVLPLDNHPDEIIWSLYEIVNNKFECIGDWNRSWEAHKVMEAFNKALTVRNKLS